MIHVLATIELEPGSRDAFLREFRNVVMSVRLEDGCIEYDAAVDLPSGLDRQAPVRDEVVVIVERWRDVPALEQHLDAPHMHAYRERIKPYVQRATLQVLEPTSRS